MWHLNHLHNISNSIHSYNPTHVECVCLMSKA
nr:MAG TPA: hypothetical protein [Caudoviricetes sp.]